VIALTRRLIAAACGFLLAVLVLPALPAAADDPADDPAVFLTQYENAATGKCLDIMERGDINGSPAVQDNCAWALGFDEQVVPRRWPNYFFVIRGLVPKCLEIENFSTANGARAAQHDCNTGPHQQWRFVPSGFTGDSALARWLSSSVMLQNVYSGKCLEVVGSSQEDGAAIVQNDCYRGLNQLWFPHSYRY
jgi:hypothetical protein